ncbi:uncharacterized protein LOC116171619 [Photinus pyralis]|nr:uncharacterized protein LOC116171619 [Photinus pyralis]
MEYLEILLSSLRANKTVKILSLKHCPINDGGCQLVCTNVRLMPSISVINLSSCNLGASSGQYIAKVINHQQLNRYSESWHNSLRYEEPENNAMGGIKRITLNNNPNLGDEGTIPILDALDDDLWIKAIDIQNCGVTENLSTRIIHLVTHSNSLEVADFRNNEGITSGSIERIFEVLQRRYKAEREPEFLWLDGSSSLHDGSTYGSRSTLVGASGSIQKTRSAPLRNFNSSDFGIQGQYRRTNTLSTVERRSRFGKFMSQNSSKELVDVKRQLMELQTLLSQETSKRIETEKINNELQKQIVGIRQLGSLHRDRFLTPEKIAKVVRVIEDLNRNGTTNPQVKCVPVKILPQSAPKPAQYPKPPEKPKNLVINLRSQSSMQNLANRKPTPNRLKSKNIPSVMSPILEVSTPSKPIEKLSAAQIFERMILKQDYDSYILQEKNREATLEYCCDIQEVKEVKLSANDDNLSSGSDSSLDMLYREMDQVDQNFSLNCRSRSTLIKRTFDYEVQHFRTPIRSASLAPS